MLAWVKAKGVSVDREVPGYVVRHAKITVSYYDMNGEKHKIRLKIMNRSLSNMRSTISTVSCSMTISMIKNPFALKEGAYW